MLVDLAIHPPQIPAINARNLVDRHERIQEMRKECHQFFSYRMSQIYYLVRNEGGK